MPASIRLDRLRCEYRENPLGLALERPRLFWQVESEKLGARQSAYQILVGSTLTGLAQNAGDLWDSGRVESSQTVHIPYGGKPLGSLVRAWWKVRAWDEDNLPSEWGSPAFWETGLLHEADWIAQWIHDISLGGPRTSAPAAYFRKEIFLDAPTTRARLVVTALGLYEFRINGQRVGDDLLTPGWTDYRRRVPYQVYDVTALLHEGSNALAAIVGDGWYSGHVGWTGRQFYGDQPKFRAQLHVGFEGARPRIFATDPTWRASFGPILQSDLLMGEAYDARRELDGWDRQGYDDGAWRTVQTPKIEVGCEGMRGPPVKVTQELTPIVDPLELNGWPANEYLFDFGQNIVGRVRLRTKGKRGTTVRLRYGEMLDQEGKLYTANLRGPLQTDYFTLRGDAESEEWEPRFTYHGFRYVEVAGLDERPTKATLTGVVMHSDVPLTGQFNCSDPRINQLAQNIDWTLRGNFLEVPTDCPQRNERLGWAGDAQLILRTASYNRDVAAFFTKWLGDLRDAQSDDGKIPPYAPYTDAVDRDGGPAWADAAVICPWTLYQCYGDVGILRGAYDSMRKFVDFLECDSLDYIRSHPSKDGFHGFGDWLAIDADTPLDLIGTAFFAYSARLLTKIAVVLENTEDVERYACLAERVRDAFRRRFVTPGGRISAGTQTAWVLALQFDLLSPYERTKAIRALVEDIEAREGHLSTGIVGSAYISRVLANNGCLDVAYRLLGQDTCPSWLYPVSQGATTVWERWDGWTEAKGFQDPGMNSFNHYALGAVGAWLYSGVAGIDVDEARPGYEHIVLRPRPGGRLRHARATYQSIRGPIASEWLTSGDSLTWEVRIPANTTASAYVPCRPTSEVEASCGARYVRHTSRAALYALPSGRFRFKSRL